MRLVLTEERVRKSGLTLRSGAASAPPLKLMQHGLSHEHALVGAQLTVWRVRLACQMGFAHSDWAGESPPGGMCCVMQRWHLVRA